MIRRVIDEWKRAAPVIWPVYRLELRIRRRQHLLGFIWIVLPILVVIFLAIAGRSSSWIPQGSVDGLPYPLFVLVGLLVWQSFADGVLLPIRQVETYRTELRTAQMAPELAIGIGLIDLLLASVVRILLILAFVSMTVFDVRWQWISLPISFVKAAALGSVAGIFCALPSLLVRDVGRALNFLLAIALIASPVFHNRETASWANLNPLVRWIEEARSAINDSPTALQTDGIALAMIVFGLLLSLIWLRAGRHRFLDAVA